MIVSIDTPWKKRCASAKNDGIEKIQKINMYTYIFLFVLSLLKKETDGETRWNECSQFRSKQQQQQK